jgi:hypothetical protein
MQKVEPMDALLTGLERLQSDLREMLLRQKKEFNDQIDQMDEVFGLTDSMFGKRCEIAGEEAALSYRMLLANVKAINDSWIRLNVTIPKQMEKKPCLD